MEEALANIAAAIREYFAAEVPPEEAMEIHEVELLEVAPSPGSLHAELPPAIPPGILRSQQAFWRDLPELLNNKKNHGKCVCYHGDERIGIADSEEPLLRQCLRRALPRTEFDLFIIQRRDLPPWEPEEVEPLGPHHLDD
jgi:hypothetical protein